MEEKGDKYMGLFKNYYGKRQVLKGIFRNTAIAAVLIIIAVVTLFPIYYMIISSFGLRQRREARGLLFDSKSFYAGFL